MALTRKMLKGMGLTEEQIDTIIEGHDETVTALKEERDDWKEKAGKAEGYKSERDKLQQQVDDAKNGTDWKAEYDKLKADTEAKETLTKVKRAYRTLLKDGSIDPDVIDSIMEATKFDGMKLDKDGNLHDADKLTEGIKSRWGKFVVTESAKPTPTPTPPAGSPGKLTRADVYAKDDKGRYKMSAEERQKALIDNNLI